MSLILECTPVGDKLQWTTVINNALTILLCHVCNPFSISIYFPGIIMSSAFHKWTGLIAMKPWCQMIILNYKIICRGVLFLSQTVMVAMKLLRCLQPCNVLICPSASLMSEINMTNNSTTMTKWRMSHSVDYDTVIFHYNVLYYNMTAWIFWYETLVVAPDGGTCKVTSPKIKKSHTSQWRTCARCRLGTSVGMVQCDYASTWDLCFQKASSF